MKHVFIINPTAGKIDRSKEFTGKIEGIFKDKSEDFEIHITQYAGHAAEIARQAAQSNEKVRLYAIGGDGTLNEVVKGAMGFDNASITSIPCGTGNDFIKSFCRDAASYFIDIADIVSCGKDMPVDAIKVGDNVCINIASAGFDANAGWAAKMFKKIVSGKMAYVLAMFICLLTKIKNRMHIKINDSEEYSGDFLFAIAANGRYYGGGFNPAPYAEINDGLMDFILIKSVSRFSILSLISKYQTGEHMALDIVTFRQGTKMEIEAEKPIAIQFDGEVVKSARTVFEILPQKVRFTLPGSLASKYKKS